MSYLDKVEQLTRIQTLNAVNQKLVDSIKIDNCRHCGRNYEIEKGGRCQKSFCLKKSMCPKCMKVCKKCNKIFCPKHINNHTCK